MIIYYEIRPRLDVSVRFDKKRLILTISLRGEKNSCEDIVSRFGISTMFIEYARDSRAYDISNVIRMIIQSEIEIVVVYIYNKQI